MTTRKPNNNGKIRIVIDCSIEERASIKIIAARNYMTISEYLLSKGLEKPNKKTLKAHQEALDGKGTTYDSTEDFLADMVLEYHAKP